MEESTRWKGAWEARSLPSSESPQDAAEILKPALGCKYKERSFILAAAQERCAFLATKSRIGAHVQTALAFSNLRNNSLLRSRTAATVANFARRRRLHLPWLSLFRSSSSWDRNSRRHRCLRPNSGG